MLMRLSKAHKCVASCTCIVRHVVYGMRKQQHEQQGFIQDSKLGGGGEVGRGGT